MAELFDSKYFRGQGKMFLADRDATGKAINAIFIGDCSAANISPNVSRGQHLESVSGARAIAASWIDSLQYTLSLTLHSVKGAHLARALQGASTAKVSASVTNEAHTAKDDAFIILAHNKISAVTITDVAGPTTYVANTDYVVHANEGLIEVLAAGSIADASVVHVDYTYAAQTHITTDPGNVAKYLIFAGKNTADSDKQIRCECFKVKIDPAALPMLGTDVANMTMSGVVEKDTLRTSGDQFFSWKIED
jgi:hypothetical protein